MESSVMGGDMTTFSSDASVTTPTWQQIRHSPVLLLATWGGSGLAPVAPGTVGTLAGLPFIALLLWLLSASGVLLVAALLLVLGSVASHRAGQAWGKPDHGAIVIDEVLGMLITLALPWYLLSPTVNEALFYTVGFAAFRVFDIGKPWPASWFDKHMKNGLGVMLDDVAAGLWAALVMAGVLQLGWLS